MPRFLLLALSFAAFLASCEQPAKIVERETSPATPPLADSQPAPAPSPALPLQDCSDENAVATLGQGLVLAPPQFSVFNDSLLTDTLARPDMHRLDGSQTAICSKFYLPEYDIMHFVCLGRTARAYRVLVNQNQVKYLPKTAGYAFRTWAEYILGASGVRRQRPPLQPHPLLRQPLRRAPLATADTLAIPAGHELFCPLEVKGDWVKVKYDCFYNQTTNPHEGEPCQAFITKCPGDATGWLRWRAANTLLIDILLMP